ncbi:MAG: cytidylate kinase family protein [Microgenomates group bacterium]
MKKLFDLINKNFERFNLPLFSKKEEKPPPVITISREKRAGGRTTAFLVAKKLGGKWRVYHKEIIDRITKEARLEKKLVEEIDERRLPFVETLINDFFWEKIPQFKFLLQTFSKSDLGYCPTRICYHCWPRR